MSFEKIKITFYSLSFLVTVMIFFSVLYVSRNIVKATSAPNIESLTLSVERGGSSQSEINLVESSNTDIYLSGIFSDMDGCADIKSNGGDVQAVLYRSGVDGGVDCTVDNKNCYRASFLTDICTLEGCDLGTETTSSFECILPLKYYAESSDINGFENENWLGSVTVIDSDFATSTLSVSTEVNSLLALEVDGAISFGQLSLGEITTGTLPISIINTGNIDIDMEISGNEMTCESGSIPVTAQRFSTLPDLTYEGMTALTTSSHRVNLNLSRQMSDSMLSTSSLYFKIAVPISGMGGNCVGVNNINAVINQ
jgi:hypothetical protein